MIRSVMNSLVAVVVVFAAPVLLAQKPVTTAPIFIDYMPVPSSLASLVNSADAVIRGTITGSQNNLVTENGRFHPTTDYTVSVNEVIKGVPGLDIAKSISVVREGGDVDLGDKIRRSVDLSFSPFQVGEQYLLFVHWNPALSRFQVQWGPDGAFRISAGVVEAMGHAATSRQLHGQRLDQVLRSLKTTAG
jgi:hypothetical protein